MSIVHTVTSQIALFNSLGVAVASDTVTTISNGQGSKTVNNAEKIWPVGPEHLVVVAHSGSIEVNWTNVRNFVTEWSRSVEPPLRQLMEYPESFLNWLNTDSKLIHADSEGDLIQGLLREHFYEVHRRMQWAIDREHEPLAEAEALQQAASAGLQYLESLPLFDGASDESDASLLESPGVDLQGLVTYLFGERAGYDTVLPVLLQSAPLVLSRAQSARNDAHLGFVGFGGDDYFAKSVRVHLRGRYGGLTRAVVEVAFGADNSTTSGSIATFAQAEAVHGFLRGAHFSLIEEAVDHVWDEVYQLVDGDDDVKIANDIAEGLREKIAQIQQERFISPMLDTIGGMSLIALAELAESLVGMQATFSAAGSGPATVGGFIETLVISRATGVRWVRRLPGGNVAHR
jgi:hypothetical protein